MLQLSEELSQARGELGVKRLELRGVTSQRLEVAAQLETCTQQQAQLQAQLAAQLAVQQHQSEAEARRWEAESRRADALQAQATDLQRQLLSRRANALDAAALTVSHTYRCRIPKALLLYRRRLLLRSCGFQGYHRKCLSTLQPPAQPRDNSADFRMTNCDSLQGQNEKQHSTSSGEGFIYSLVRLKNSAFLNPALRPKALYIR